MGAQQKGSAPSHESFSWCSLVSSTFRSPVTRSTPTSGWSSFVRYLRNRKERRGLSREGQGKHSAKVVSYSEMSSSFSAKLGGLYASLIRKPHDLP